MRPGSSLNRGLSMEISDEGFSTPLALAAVFSLCILSLPLCMISSATGKYISSYGRAVSERKKIDSVIYDMEEKIQPLKELPSDADENEISFLIASACNYDFKVTDVSTGINRNFASGKFLESKAISDYVTSGGDCVFADYGWINPMLADKTIIEHSAKEFDGSDTFPLVNSLPSFNVH